MIRRARRYGINVLGHDQAAIAKRFARKGADKFDEVDWELDSELPRLDETASWIACRLHELVDGGDHVIAVGSVERAQAGSAHPLLYRQRAIRDAGQASPGRTERRLLACALRTYVRPTNRLPVLEGAVVTDAFLVGGVRTPFGRYRGALADVRPDDLAALVVRAALDRAGSPRRRGRRGHLRRRQPGRRGQPQRRAHGDPARRPARRRPGLHRQPPLRERACRPSRRAQQIRSGEADVVVAGGVESMTRAPSVLAKPARPYATPPELADTTLGWRLVNPRMRDVDGGKATISLGDTAEEVAILDGITRAESDAFGLRSQRLAAASTERRRADLVPVPVGRATVDADEVPRPDTSPEALAALRPAFRSDGIVTAGSASPLRTAPRRSSWRARRRWSATASSRARGSSPRRGRRAAARHGPRPGAVERAGARARRLDSGDLDAVEINEAFAPQVIASVRRLGLDPSASTPTAARSRSATRSARAACGSCSTSCAASSTRAARRGLATLCIGVGQGLALLVERP